MLWVVVKSLLLLCCKFNTFCKRLLIFYKGGLKSILRIERLKMYSISCPYLMVILPYSHNNPADKVAHLLATRPAVIVLGDGIDYFGSSKN